MYRNPGYQGNVRPTGQRKYFMKKGFLTTIALAAMLATEGMIEVASAMWVRTPPPRARSSRAIGRPSRPGQVWTPGFYSWRGGRRGRYTWVPGRWATPPRSGAEGVAPRGRRSGTGNGFVAGRGRGPPHNQLPFLPEGFQVEAAARREVEHLDPEALSKPLQMQHLSIFKSHRVAIAVG